MSIYFVHFFGVFFSYALLSALFFYNLKNLLVFKLAFTGFVFAYFAFFISSKTLSYDLLYFFNNVLFVLICLMIITLIYIQNNLIKERIQSILVFLLSFAFGIRYLHISIDFPILSTNFLDSLAISSFGFILLAFILCFGVYLFTRWLREFDFKFLNIFLLIIIVSYLNEVLAQILLHLMREGVIETESLYLSYVAKSVYYAKFYTYLWFLLLGACVFLVLKQRVSENTKKKDFDIEFRKNHAKNSKITSFSVSIFSAIVLSLCIFLFYDLHASRPVTIDEPTYVEPNENDEFVFNVEILRDNKLHRFAYISDEGKVVRFFLINKREDKDSPVAVFDACSICGDMGYVKRGGELICISCNVRIFLPSVGKAGGCNPVPMKYKFENGKVTIPFSEILDGVNFFTQVVEKKVYDPIDNTELINLKAPRSYVYKGRTYFFANEKNYEEFKNDPLKYIDTNKTSKYRIHNLIGNNYAN
ncbi:ferrirhodotorulic acid ABC transporter membrane protein [Campylobacter sp. RM16704]|uniref:ferrirhodotorulic acid ABC transporter membrane protein n=1 Tax=Campylobacter sp. RM16704 TaxID=1500960 RepID=UPI0005807755|nr:ferrirhodotorulic acid ABC transporter membrane protein [Campylobacter sp. RM16704]AJC86638.1 ferrirhodotorulic acid ABC transporter, permease protein [Campylobacter sp. RM16704]